MVEIGIGESVFDGGVLRIEFRRYVGLGDTRKVMREVVSLEAKGADPD